MTTKKVDPIEQIEGRHGLTSITLLDLKEGLMMYEQAISILNDAGYYDHNSRRSVALAMVDHASRMMAAEAEDNQYARRNR